ncbi:CCA tRNA nucleotidyltransferase [Natranaerobius thermophilus]|uniref:Polynucleotide adenylyltransferase region n=1 Tax=Natranaerobius thermophilus (strain ATCC BAA-1301 / DSM 18059 / JW/NM-WN-LF) TaxID=457570 RepID=B2A0P2_NATTJ|nr:CCA tRNA nucleotidyltransferase [Natranaerobius thermophilus]ACB85922.1 Polynucleotide adenylyltransferase region [Natranaerobius thermophilus JW/NM-WN-LF]
MTYNLEIALNSLIDRSGAKLIGKGFLVGGSLRDLLSGKIPVDLDLVFNREDLEVIVENLQLSQRRSDKGDKFIILDQGRQIFRFIPAEPETKIFVDLMPLKGRDLQEDLGCRDFTINAMALSLDKMIVKPNPKQGSVDEGSELLFKIPNSTKKMEQLIIDPFQGKLDLKHKVVRPVSQRIMENDPLRCLRAFRFFVLGYDLSREILNLIEEGEYSWSDIYGQIAQERIYHEMKAIWASNSSLQRQAQLLQLMQVLGFDEHINFRQNNLITLSSILEMLLDSWSWSKTYPQINRFELAFLLWDLAGFNFYEELTLPKSLKSLQEGVLRGRQQIPVNVCSKCRYRFYARELVKFRDSTWLKLESLGWLLNFARTQVQEFNSSSNVEFNNSRDMEGVIKLSLKKEAQIIPLLITRYKQIKEKYDGNWLLEHSGKDPGPWLKQALQDLHYQKLIGDESGESNYE